MTRIDDGFDYEFGLDPGTADTESSVKPMILAVGDVRQWIGTGRALPDDSQIAFAEFHEVTEELMDALTPDIVMSPVMTRAFDCLDLAQALQAAGFRGRFRVVAPELPNPKVIQAEIRAICPALDVALIFCGPSDIRHLH